MKKIFIAPKNQYGYITDYYQMAKRLASRGLVVEVVCFDEGLPRVEVQENIQVLYVARSRYKLINYLRHINMISKRILADKAKIKWVVISANIEFSGILPSLLKLFTPNARWILDIRTCSVFQGVMKRKIYDKLIKASAFLFDRTTIISPLVARRLEINEFDVLPLGSDTYVELESKKYSRKKVDFLYVGVFDDRRVGDLIAAFDLICEKQGWESELTFHIVGFSYREEESKILQQQIENSIYKKQIVWHGKKSHDEIKDLFQTASIGFSYIPKTEFFDVQPPTKTYEYILNGIICIATNTRANAEIINYDNGILVNDNISSLVEGIETVLDRLEDYNSLEMVKSVEKNKWENIIADFQQLLEEIEVQAEEMEESEET